jgi:hypothetical protein
MIGSSSSSAQGTHYGPTGSDCFAGLFSFKRTKLFQTRRRRPMRCRSLALSLLSTVWAVPLMRLADIRWDAYRFSTYGEFTKRYWGYFSQTSRRIQSSVPCREISSFAFLTGAHNEVNAYSSSSARISLSEFCRHLFVRITDKLLLVPSLL